MKKKKFLPRIEQGVAKKSIPDVGVEDSFNEVLRYFSEAEEKIKQAQEKLGQAELALFHLSLKFKDKENE